MNDTAANLWWVALPYAALAIFVVGHIWRYRTSAYTWTTRSTQLLERKWLRVGSLSFHVGMLLVVVDAVRDDLGVGVGRERVALFLEVRTQLFVVLDDAIVNDGDRVTRQVRVGVGFVGHAVRRPARMGDAGAAADR